MQGHVNNIVHARKTDKQVARWDTFKTKVEVSEKTRIRMLAQRLMITCPIEHTESRDAYAERLTKWVKGKGPWSMEDWQVLNLVDKVVSAHYKMSRD